jgi:hypothetical protein
MEVSGSTRCVHIRVSKGQVRLVLAKRTWYTSRNQSQERAP